jgi:hypothetical protein
LNSNETRSERFLKKEPTAGKDFIVVAYENEDHKKKEISSHRRRKGTQIKGEIIDSQGKRIEFH